MRKSKNVKLKKKKLQKKGSVKLMLQILLTNQNTVVRDFAKICIEKDSQMSIRLYAQEFLEIDAFPFVFELDCRGNPNTLSIWKYGQRQRQISDINAQTLYDIIQIELKPYYK